MAPLSYLIVGCGHFGSRAVRTLLEKNRHAKITVVDREERAFQKIRDLPMRIILDEGVSYLRHLLEGRERIDIIIPAVPFHLAFELLLSSFKPLGAERGGIPPLEGLPNPVIGEAGDLYTSISDFLCPSHCPEPASHCTVTRKKRKKAVYRILTDLNGPFDSRVIRSQQLGLGVGGFKATALLDLWEKIERGRRSDRLILVSTACRCHGVVSALSFVQDASAPDPKQARHRRSRIPSPPL